MKCTFSLHQFVDLFSLVLLGFSPLDPLNQRLVQFHLPHHWNSCLTVNCCISVGFPIVCCVAMLGQPLQKMAIIKLPVKINMQLPFPVQPTWRLVSCVYSCRQKSTNIDALLHFLISL